MALARNNSYWLVNTLGSGNGTNVFLTSTPDEGLLVVVAPAKTGSV